MLKLHGYSLHHCCLTKLFMMLSNILAHNRKMTARAVVDLNLDLRSWGFPTPRFLNVHRQTCICATYWFSAAS